MLNRCWNHLIGIGIDSQTPASETRQIVFLNAVVLLVLILVGQNIVLGLIYSVPPALLLLFVAHGLFIGIVLLWNKLRLYLFARVWFAVAATIFLSIYQVLMGTESRWDVFLVVCVFLQCLMFPATQRRWMVAVMIFTGICFFAVDFALNVPPKGLMQNLSASYWSMEKAGNLAGFLFCGIAMGSVAFQVINRAERNLAIERDRSDRLLTNILPVPIAERLKQSQGLIADDFDETTVLFADIVGFTQYTETVSPKQLIALLNSVFTKFDDLSQKYRAEKIKTIGDAYMAVAGVPIRSPGHAEQMAELALQMQQVIERHNLETGQSLQIRIGLHSGPVIAGVIGKRKFAYDLWGDTVNTAARMESHGVPGEIQVTSATHVLLEPNYHFEERGLVDIKSKGPMQVFLLKGKRRHLTQIGHEPRPSQIA
jgi:class 3 adenylate cyclase